jgi:quercetin dioxygenase-like cupin family protein
MSDRLAFPDGSEYAVLNSPADPERDPLLMEFLLQPRCVAPPPHVHPGGQRETFEVLDGAFELRRGRTWHRLEAGEALTIEPGEVHTFRNHETTPARVHNVHEPAHSFERYIRRIHAVAIEHDFSKVTPRAALYLAALMREHRDTIVPAVPLRLPIALLATIARVLRLRLPD